MKKTLKLIFKSALSEGESPEDWKKMALFRSEKKKQKYFEKLQNYQFSSNFYLKL